MQSVLLTGRPFLKISMRCRYTLRKPTSSFFQARNQKCRSPSLLPRQWCAKTPSPTWRKVREPVLSLSSTICVPLVHQKYGYFHTELNFPSVNWLSCSFLPPFPSFIFLLSFRFSPLFALVRFYIAFWKRFKESKTGSLTFLYHCGAILYKLCCKIHGHFRMREMFSFDHKLFQDKLFIHTNVAVNNVKFWEWQSHFILSVYGK